MKQSHRVLLVDDDPQWLETHRELLSDNGLDVRTARDGWGALAFLQDDRFDLVVVDADMPRMDGIHLLKELRMKFAKLPIVMCLAGPKTQPADAREIFRLGATAILEKRESETQLLPLAKVLLIVQELKEVG